MSSLPLPPAAPDPTPLERLRSRWEAADHSRRRALAVGGTITSMIVLVALAAAIIRGSAPAVEQTLPRVSSTVSSRQTGTTAHIVVHAAGAVVRPGVYRLRGTARTIDAIDAAGGLAADAQTDALNLAAPVTDGMRVYVPRAGETPPPVEGGTGEPVSSASSLVNINTAGAADLEKLPGVGPATAQAIIDHRDDRGRFSTVDDLLDVRGIGEAKLEALRNAVTV